MLKVMRRIVQEVNASESLADALQLMVEHVRRAFETQACSIFLFDRDAKQLVLMATDGLNPEKFIDQERATLDLS